MKSAFRRFFRGCIGLLAATWLVGCGASACPTRSAANPSAHWEADLLSRPLLVTHPERAITVKRDVHEFYIPADADDVARAFHAVMRDPNRHYGLIQVKRPAQDINQPFHQGSRFQGDYEIENTSSFWSGLGKTDLGRQAFCAIEAKNTSDYGEISGLDLPPDPAPSDRKAPAAGTSYFMEYRYLQGSPIGGSSRFEVKQIADKQTVLTQIFTYQETTASFAAIFANGVLTLHDKVVRSQVAQTAALLHVAITQSDVPTPYRIP